MNASTVSSVDIVGTGKEYNYAAGGIIAGPVGALVGGFAPKAFKDDTVQFRINFRDGNVAHFSGSPREYRSALNASYKGQVATPATPSTPTPAPVATEPGGEVAQLRAEVAKLRSEIGLPATEDALGPAAATAPAPVDVEAERRAEAGEVVRRGIGMSAEEKVARRGLPKRTDGIATRLWFEGVAELEYVKAPPTGGDRKTSKAREAVNAEHRAAYKRELLAEKKVIERVIRDLSLPMQGYLALMSEVGDEFRNRTLR